MAYSEEERQSIVFQTAFKGGVAIASTLPGDEESKQAAAIRIAEYLREYLWDFHGWNVPSSAPKPYPQPVNADHAADISAAAEMVVKDAFPGTERVAAGTKDEHFVAPRAGTDGYEFTGDCKLPIPDWFYTEVEKKGKTHIKFWWDNRTPEGNPPTTANGKVGPAFKSKGKDKANEVAIFKPTPRAR